jgi:hypothetical protein
LEVLFCAVVVDQVFDNETRELIDSSINRQPLVDDLASENVFEAFIRNDSFYRSPAGTIPMMLSSLLSSRRRMRVVSN